MADLQWRYQVETVEHGPVTLDELLGLLTAGTITLATPVLADDMQKWTALSAVETIRPRVLAALRARAAAEKKAAATAPVKVSESAPAESPPDTPADTRPSAPLTRRVAAMALDSVFILSALWVATWVLGLEFSLAEPIGSTSRLFLVGLVIAWPYCAGLECSREQATLGKIVMDLRVIDRRGSRVSFARASLRFLANAVLVCVIGVPQLSGLIDRRRRTLADWISGCQVVLAARR